MPYLSIIPQMSNKSVCVRWKARKIKNKKDIPFLPGAASLDGPSAPTLVPRGFWHFFWSSILQPQRQHTAAKLCLCIPTPSNHGKQWETRAPRTFWGAKHLSGCIRCRESKETAKHQLRAPSMLRHWLTNKPFLFWRPRCLNILLVTSTVQIILCF